MLDQRKIMNNTKKHNFDSFIQGELIDLVVLTKEIAEKSNWYNWFNNEKTTLHMQKHYYPNTQSDQKSFFNEIIKNNDRLIQLGIIDKEKLILFGIISLGNINYINRNAEWSLMIGEKEYRKLIYANEAIDLLLKHAFFSLNLHKVTGGYIETLRDWGIFMQKRFNFKVEGTLKEHVYKAGRFQDVTLIGLLKSDYKKQK